ncbi:protein kinase domain-containing protein [Pedobacter gandavensis]|uniref:protein kinase domain-containing protein n=1 Tax=Pedobacter gandavensis TaxID=2679963 RepID=UPI00293126D3|nr:protein kinase [Pedobacter gandavensis]
MIGEIYLGLKQNPYTAGRRIGQGGEGDVFEIKENTSLVIKIYREVLDVEKSDKLIFMSTLVNDELTKFAAWPVDVAKDKLGHICGFVMRKLEAYVPLHNLFSPMDRKKLFPDKGYNFLIHVARNLAIAFHKIHQLGIIVGDVNEANILVNSGGMVSLIDCDSFQIKKENKYYFCEVGIPRYTPPELLVQGSFNSVIRTTNTDGFSLGTLIFQLLFLGRAPFTGINPTNQEIDEETAIKTHEFAYSLKRRNKKLLPAKNSLDLSTMTSGMITLFHATFEGIVERPTAAMWVNELTILGKGIVQCAKTKIHYYLDVIGHCPWCQFRDKSNIIYFLDDSYLRAIPELNNIEQFVNGFKIERIELKKLMETYVTPGMVAKPINRRFYKLKYLNRIVISVIVIITIILCLSINWGILLGGVAAIYLFSSISKTTGKIHLELIQRQNNFNSLKLSFQDLIKQHNNPSDLNKYNQSSSTFSKLIDSFKALPVEFNLSKKKIEEDHYLKKMTFYLQQFDVRSHSIATFAASKKLLIYNNGIRTAADISKLRNTKIVGIGPKNIQILLDWQRQISAGFVYVPDASVLNIEFAAASDVIINKQKKLEIQIKTEHRNLEIYRASILSSTDRLGHQFKELSIKLYQAELDLNAFKILKGYG